MDRATRFLWDMHCGRKDRKMFKNSEFTRLGGRIGKKGATYAACFRDLVNDLGMLRLWAATDRCVAA
jgi:hypothetical protein